jgi:hypothetical protein
MGYEVNRGSEENLESAISFSILANEHKACSVEGCNLDAEWNKFKKDPTQNNFVKATSRGHRIKNGKMEAKSPPGWGGTVEHMKEHSNITNPHALAWYLYQQGDDSHKAAPKGTGAKHVSKEVAKKRSKALKGEGGVQESINPQPRSTHIKKQLQERHESGLRAKGKKKMRSDTRVGDIQAPKKKVKAEENLDHGVSMSKKVRAQIPSSIRAPRMN